TTERGTMELRQLRCFLVLAEELHFGRTAERLKATQPVVRRSIQDLEAELGEALLVRQDGGLLLTAAGCAFAEGARRILGDSNHPIPAPIIARASGSALRVGQLASATSRFIPQVIAAFRERYPEQPMQLSTGSSPEQIAGVRANQCDVAFVRLPID